MGGPIDILLPCNESNMVIDLNGGSLKLYLDTRLVCATCKMAEEFVSGCSDMVLTRSSLEGDAGESTDAAVYVKRVVIPLDTDSIFASANEFASSFPGFLDAIDNQNDAETYVTKTFQFIYDGAEFFDAELGRDHSNATLKSVFPYLHVGRFIQCPRLLAKCDVYVRSIFKRDICDVFRSTNRINHGAFRVVFMLAHDFDLAGTWADIKDFVSVRDYTPIRNNEWDMSNAYGDRISMRKTVADAVRDMVNNADCTRVSSRAWIDLLLCMI